MKLYGIAIKYNQGKKNITIQETCLVCLFWLYPFYFDETSTERQIWTSSKPSSLIGWELILVKSPQEGTKTCHFLLELWVWDWLGEIKAWSLIWQYKRRVVQEALKNVYIKKKLYITFFQHLNTHICFAHLIYYLHSALFLAEEPRTLVGLWLVPACNG